MPADEDELVPLATFMLVPKVVDGPSALGLWETVDEFLIAVVFSPLLGDNLGVIFVEIVNEVLVFVAKF